MRTLSIKARLALLVTMLMALLVLAVVANLTRQHEATLQIEALYTQGLAGVTAEQAQQRAREVRAAYDGALWRNIGITVIALGIAGAIAAHLTRSITVPLGQAVALAESVAGGDLRRMPPIKGRDELSDLLHALSTMGEGLASLVGRVHAASGAIAGGSAEIAGGNADLSRRTEQAASSLEETAASMEQLGASVRHNAETARQAAAAAGQAAAVAEQGGSVVQRVVQTMDQIAAASRRITDIVGVIDGIAFQTNLLALNAAVEAARAGEQGRGFAVVAGEVRGLAQRAATAAREIKQLIGESHGTVEGGLRHADAAGQTIQQMVAQARSVSALIAAISDASAEQSRGIAQVGAAVQQLDQVTQQNAALVEQSAAAAESLRDQAAQLNEVVAVFRLS